MQISVAGRQVDLSAPLRRRVALQLDTIAGAYFDDALAASVTFGQARSFFTCDIDLQAGPGLLVRGEGEATDAHGAFDDAAEHIARRLRRYRRRLGGHARDLRHRARPSLGRHYVLRQERDGPGAAPAAYATVVSWQDSEVGTLSVGEAVMQLDLADRAVMVFRNSASGGINVVYRRPDGLIGWLDPDAAAG